MASFWRRPERADAAASVVLCPTPSRGSVEDDSPATEDTSPATEDAAASLVETVSKVLRTLYTKMRANLPADAAQQSPEALQRKLGEELEGLLGEFGVALDERDQQTVIRMLLDDVFGFGPLSELMRDPDVSDILVNGPFQTFVEKQGKLSPSDATFDDMSHLLEVVQRMASNGGRRIDTDCPMVDVRLPDGSRMNAILNPPAINGPLISIRRFGARPLTVDDLIENETLAPEMLEFLAACVRYRFNIIFSGGTGSGKTTLLNALSRFIRASERIATIEDTAELELQQPHVVKLESSPANADGTGEITIRTLVTNSLRMRPDRIIIGECRGPEIIEMLQAMNTGHSGSMTTIHANSPREAFSRTELMIGMGNVEIPLVALRKQLATSVNLIIQIARLPGGQRRVVNISEVTGMEGDTISMHEIFVFARTGIDNDNSIGHFEATGIRPACWERLVSSGAKIPLRLFSPGVIGRSGESRGN